MSVTIEGKISWLHGLNPVRKQPNRVAIHLMDGNSEVIFFEISKKDLWSWHFQIAKPAGSRKGYWVTQEPVMDYQTYMEDDGFIINIHKSVMLDEQGIPLGQFVSDDRTVFPPIPEKSIFLGDMGGFWFV